MAEEAGQFEEQKERGPLMGALLWLVATRNGLLSIWITLAAFGLSGALVCHFYRQPIFLNSEHWVLFSAATTLLLLPVLLLLLDSPDNYADGPRLWLPLVTLALLLCLSALALTDSILNLDILAGEYGETAKVAFLAFFLTAFIPRVWNAVNFARFDAERRHERAREARQAYVREHRARYPQAEISEHEVPRADVPETTSAGALLATIIVAFIGILAFIAGDGASLSLRTGFGFFLCFSVIGVFIVVVCVDAFSELDLVRNLSRGFETLGKVSAPLAAFYGWIDSALVRIGASVVGMGHRTLGMRYTVLIGTMATLCLMGWYLPPPFGLAPTFIGFVFAISVSRLWNWVEDDRALAALTKYKASAPYQTDFREDFRDETLLGFAFVFLFAPIAMMQANDGGVFGQELFRNADGRHLGDWIGFFGIELAKAIPVVDWAEIYGVDTTADMISINGAASRHAVFLARVMVDLVLIAALLQALGVWTRNRQQKQLYSAGHIDRLDPFVERVELMRAIRATKSETDSTDFNLSALRANDLVDFRRYNEDHLRTLYGASTDELKRAFIERIAKERGIALVSAIDLTIEIAESHGNEVDLISAFNRAVQEHQSNVHAIDPDDLFRILTGLRTKSGLRHFKERVVDTLEEVASPEQLIDLLSGLAEGERADHFQYARRYMSRAIDKARRTS